MILRKTEGNPFFVEEVVRSLIDSGAIARDKNGMRWRATTNVHDVTVPDNLQALLVARMDRLERDVRRTLQLAAVIGRSFYYRVLDMISDASVTLDSTIAPNASAPNAGHPHIGQPGNGRGRKTVSRMIPPSVTALSHRMNAYCTTALRALLSSSE